MKNFIFIILLSFTSLVGYSQILVEDFEAAPDNADASGVWTLTSGNWSVRDNRTNTGQNWKKNTVPFPAHNGTKAAFIDRENLPGIVAEEWLITPQRPITANSQLRFFTRQGLNGDDSNAKYQVRVSSAADQNDLGAYTVLVEYTETQLSEITEDQLDYEEKIIPLPFTGARYFAFVRVTTQPGLQIAGDRWLVDDVKIVATCREPEVLLVDTATITSSVTKLLWNAPTLSPTQNNYEVQYGPTGFTLDIPAPNVFIQTVTSGTTPRSYTATGLLPNSPYQFYVRSVCDDSKSAWVGPFNWITKPLGRTCQEPIVVTPLPYSNSSNTSIYGNNIVPTSPGSAAGCGAGTGTFLTGNDVVYSYTVAETGNIAISMNPLGVTNTGIFVYASCTTIGNTCIAGAGNSNASTRTIPFLAVTAGQTIYIVISSTGASFAYNLNIQYTNANCLPPPVPTTSPVTVLGPTSASTSWTNATGTTATTWEIAVQPAGGAIPTVAGVSTTTNTAYVMDHLLTGEALQASHQYQYWVRADCGGGVYSIWSGPIAFQTAGCELTDRCNYTFTLTDTGTDGWEGGRMQVIQGGLVLEPVLGTTFTSGGTATVTIPLCNNMPFSLFWSEAGASPDEVRISIKNGFNQTIYALATNGQALIGTTLYTGTVDCLNPLCLKPTSNPTVPAASITFNGATINWTVAGASATTTTGWEIYVVPQGSPVPDGTTTTPYNTVSGPGTSASFVIPAGDLLPDFNYTVYIRALCSVNGPSDWTGGTNFKTKEQCFKPTVLTAPTVGNFGATLGWTSAAGGGTWQILVQLASLPAPDITNPNWVTTNGGGLGTGPNGLLYSYVTPLSLIPETQYEFYIRRDCGAGIISNPTGPKAFTTGVACPKPTAQTVTNITAFGAKFGWTNPTGTDWQVLILPAGSAAPTANSTGWVTASSNPFDYNATIPTNPALIPETNYVYYVRSNCGSVNGLSTWTGPKPFTTLQTCFKPTNLQSNTLTAFSVNLTWSSVPSTTLWQVLALPAGSAPPTAETTGWVTTNGSGTTPPSFNYGLTPETVLTPETSYVFYVRGSCGDVNGNSSWTGPRPITTPPSCYKPVPTSLTALNITPFTADLKWINDTHSPVNEWQILIVNQGDPAPTTAQQGTLITQNPYPAIGLTQNTCYAYYVRSSCGGINGVSTWSGPFNFCTIPTCPKPTGLAVTNNLAPTANLSWSGPANASQWQLIYAAPGEVSPTNTTPLTEGILLSTPAFTTPELEPGFYEYFVRAICSDTDRSFWSGPFSFFIALPPAVCASIDIPIPTTSPGVIDLCPGLSCVNLTGSFTDSKDTTSYTVLPTVFAPPFPFTGGIQLDIAKDDIWGPVFPLPFNFCYFGTNYPSVQVGSNGVVSFTTTYPPGVLGGCLWNTDPAITVPNAAFPIKNAIYGVYQDIDPSVSTAPIARSINYQVLGVAPCRAFVVNFLNMHAFTLGGDDCANEALQTSQIVMYETSNIIEVYVQDRTSCSWNDGLGVVGIQNANGSLGYTPPGRNLGNWEAHNEAWRFTPNGASNVQFSWLKGGAFYSNDTTINVCVSETTNMTAKAVYTGCGGQITTKTKDVLLRINPLIIPAMQPVQACQSYTLPVLPVGNYFSEPNGVGPIDRTVALTSSQTVYVYAVSNTTPPCTAEINFPVSIVPDLTAPTPGTATGCQNYILPALPIPFNYYTDVNGTGTMYTGSGGDAISTSQMLYIYGESGSGSSLCSDQSTLNISVDTVQLFAQTSLSDCNSITLQPLPANNTYYSAPGGPTGTGEILNAGDIIDEDKTIYIYAENGTCHDEGNFTVSIFGIPPPTFTATQPLCGASPAVGSIVVTSPLSPSGGVASDLFISEVTDESLSGSSLSYIEIFNGTGAPKNLSNYKLKIYNNGSTTSNNCDVVLSGTIPNNDTYVIRISTSGNQGGVNPDLTITACNGINTNDNIRLTNLSDVEIDVWGANDGSDFTPNGETGYDYRRNSASHPPSTTWNPADWTANPDPIYGDIGFYPPFSSNVYQYNIDNGAWQFSTSFINLPIGTYTLTAQDILTGCTSSATVDIHQANSATPVTTISYTPEVCQSIGTLSPDPSLPGFVTNGTYTADSSLLSISPTTGEINVSASTPGTYVVTYSVLANIAGCVAAGHTDFTVVIKPILTPNFPASLFGPFCSGVTVPDLSTMLTSPNSVVGTWSPAAISNTAGGTYTFTPAANQCALPFAVTITVNPIETPNFLDEITICSGSAVPPLLTTAPNGIIGTWSPSAINPVNAGSYVFTATPVGNRCFNTQTIAVTIAANPEFGIVGGCINGNYTLTVTSASDFQNATYVWKDQSGAIVGGNTSSITVTATGDYTCEVTYQGCSTPKMYSVATISCSIQKGISPKGTNGGDGSNDYFDLEGQNVTKLEIFNRYGAKVYTKSHYSKEWYGQSDNGDELPDGTYYYVIERDGEKSRTGWIYINHEL